MSAHGDVFPVVFGICLDAEAIWLAINPENAHRPAQLSHGAYEINEGLVPLLDVLERNSVAATFFVPGITAERYPNALRLILARGHELGAHNYTHRTPVGLSVDEERAELAGGIEAITASCGIRPVTWRSPSWEWTDATLDLLLEQGISVSTNFHDRAGPYRHRRGGSPLKLVELPVQWHLGDAVYFMHGGRMERVVRTAAEVESLWTEEFLGHYDWPGAFFHLTLHVQLIAQPGRLRMLERFIRFMASHPRVRFLTSAAVAERVP